MKDVNRVILMGRLGNDPIQRETKKGTTVVNFSMATSRKIYPEVDVADTGDAKEGEEILPVEETNWHRIVSWGKLGELCAQYLKKGSPVFIEGSIRARKYTAKDGTEKYSYEIHADDVSFLGGGIRAARPEESVTEEAETARSA